VSPGQYEIAAEVDGISTVLPFFGIQAYQAATDYRESFYIGPAR
jgi:hypothetical protein